MPHYEDVGKAKVKNIRRVGKSSWVIPIPQSYGDYVFNEYKNKGEIELYFINGKMIITPLLKGGNKEIGETSLSHGIPEEIEAKISAAYLGGYDKIKLMSYSKDYEAGLQNIKNRLPGTIANFDSADEVKIDFQLPYKNPEKEVYQTFQLCEEISSRNKADMENYPEIEPLDTDIRAPYNYLEEEIDKTSFGVKRTLMITATKPSEYQGIELDDIRNTFEYYQILTNLERLSDLQDSISRNLRVLKKCDSKASKNIFKQGKYSLLDYHNSAFDLVEKAFESKDDIKLAYEIISTKDNIDPDDYIKYRGRFIPHKKRKSLIETLHKIGDGKELTSWRLNLIEQSIWSMTSIGINIAQLGQNLNRPKLIER